MAQTRIFVSYNRKDIEFTQRLVADLHQAGAEVWVDVEGIDYGNFMERIDDALAMCEWMGLVLSPSAIEPSYMRQETYMALHRVQQSYIRAVIPVGRPRGGSEGDEHGRPALAGAAPFSSLGLFSGRTPSTSPH